MTEWILSSSVLILLVALLRRLLRGRIGLRLQYAVWLLVLVRLLIPGTVGESALSVQRPLENIEKQVTETALSGNWAVVVMPVDGETVAFPEADGDGQGPSQPAPEPQSSTVGTLLAPLGALLEILWYAGMALTGLLLVLSNLAFYWKLRRTRQLLETGMSTRVYSTDSVQSLCLFGLLRPAIYIPAAVAEEGEALRHVLAHEEAHRRHGDHLWTALRGVCLVLHWYNPLVWWAAALSRRDSELACDEAAVKALGEEQRAAYGRTLVGLAEQHSGLMRCATSMSGSDLKERIAVLVAKPTTRWAAAGVLATAVVVIALCAFTGSQSQEEPADSGVSDAAVAGDAGIAYLTSEFLLCAGDQGVTLQMRTAPDGPDYAAYTVDAQWVERNILSLFDSYDTGEDTYTILSGEAEDIRPSEGLFLQLDAPGFTIQFGADDVVRFLIRNAAVEWTAQYLYGPDVISDSIFSVCREQYDQLVLGSLTDLTLPGTAEVEAADALHTLWNTWLARAEQRLPPGSRWGITDYRLDGTVTEMTTAEDGGAVRAVWEMDVLLQPEDYESTLWWIGNAVGAEVDHGEGYAGWIELGYRGWLIRDGESGLWSIPDFGTGGYTMENLLMEYPLDAGTGSVTQALPEELAAYIPGGMEIIGCGSEGTDSWVNFKWDESDGTSSVLLIRQGGTREEWTDAMLHFEEAEEGGVIAYLPTYTSGEVDFYETAHHTVAVWERGQDLYVLAAWYWPEADHPALQALGQLEPALLQYPEFLLGTEAVQAGSDAAVGVYTYEKEGFGGNFTIALDPDGTFQYYEGLLSSHMGLGTWEVEGDTLTLREDESQGYGFVNRFTIAPEGLVFRTEGSDNFLYVEVADGERFLGPPLETETGGAGPGWTSYRQELSRGGYAMELRGYTNIVYSAFSDDSLPPFLPAEGEFQPVNRAQLADVGGWECLEEFGDCALYRGADTMAAMWTGDGIGWALTVEGADQAAREALMEVMESIF